jgi:hypothetical protein
MAIINEPVELGKYNVAHRKIIITSIYHIRNAVCKSTITSVVIMCKFRVMLKNLCNKIKLSNNDKVISMSDKGSKQESRLPRMH